MDLLTATLALLAVLVPLWIYRTSQRKRTVQLIDKMPGPPALPVIGTAWLVFNIKRNEFFKFAETESKKYWPLFRTWNGVKPEVHICDAEDAEVIFSSSVNIEKSYLYDFLRPWLGNGLLTSKGRKWHTHRKLITPTFHFKILENFFEVFVEKSELLIEKLGKEVGNPKGFDVYPYITNCALDIICETAMGVEINAQANSDSAYVKAVYEVSELILQRILSPWLYNPFIYSITKAGRLFNRDLKILHGFTNQVIQERKQEMANMTRTEESEDDQFIGRKKRMAFLDLLLKVSQGETPLTDEEIREEVDTFMFEGHDTTSASLGWTLFLLGNNPDAQERVYEELQGIFHGSSRLPTMKDLAEMKYLERVIKESLRLYPSVPFIGRKLTQDVNIGGYKIPEGVEINIHICHLHRNDKYFPNPDEFNPDNFLPEKVQGRHPYAYVPFSAGSRNCIGQKFALLEEKVVLSSVLRNYKVRSLEKPEDITLMGELILRPENGVKMTIERR